MNATITHELNRMPRNIEQQLSELELKHMRHQDLMGWQEYQKAEARRRHRYGENKYKPIPILLV
jgi:hypothetical protein